MAGMNKLMRGMIIDVNLEPTLGSETDKIRSCVIVTNDVFNEQVPVFQVVRLPYGARKRPESQQMLKSIADCLKTRPINHRHRLVTLRGKLSSKKPDK